MDGPKIKRHQAKMDLILAAEAAIVELRNVASKLSVPELDLTDEEIRECSDEYSDAVSSINRIRQRVESWKRSPVR